MRPFTTLVTILVLASPVLAQPQEGGEPATDSTELAKQTQNPIADLISIPLQFEFHSGGGLEGRSATVLNVQPVIPIHITSGWNLIARPVIPFVSTPDLQGGHENGLADIEMQLFATPVTDGELMWGVGPVMSLPTATNSDLSTGSWALGPAAVGVFTRGPWVVGGLATQLWTVADYGDSRKVTQTFLQPFVNYNFGHSGWAAVSAPKITIDWNAPGNDWVVPVGGGVTYTTKIGDQHMQFGAQYYLDVEPATDGPRNELRFNISFLFPNKKVGSSSVACAQASL